MPVSVFYLRAGYTPEDYPTGVEWQARRIMERSSAALCPSVAYQLVGAKKVQQDLAAPGVLRLCCTSVARLLQNCCASAAPLLRGVPTSHASSTLPTLAAETQLVAACLIIA